MDKIISSITNILNIDDEILTKFLGYLHPMTVSKKNNINKVSHYRRKCIYN